MKKNPRVLLCGKIYDKKTQSIGILAFLIIAIVLTTFPAQSQDNGTDAMRQLQFLNGSWSCQYLTSKGSETQNVVYSFSPDGLWMTESSQPSSAGQDDWALQVWGYDRRAGKLVAYNFAANGVYTKTVDGWIAGEFRSRRDDNGLVVALKKVNSTVMKWVVEKPDSTALTSEICTKLNG